MNEYKELAEMGMTAEEIAATITEDEELAEEVAKEIAKAIEE